MNVYLKRDLLILHDLQVIQIDAQVSRCLGQQQNVLKITWFHHNKTEIKRQKCEDATIVLYSLVSCYNLLKNYNLLAKKERISARNSGGLKVLSSEMDLAKSGINGCPQSCREPPERFRATSYSYWELGS